MAEVKKLTILDLLKEKEKYEVKKGVTKDVRIERFDANIVVQVPDRELCVESQQMARDEDTATQANVHMVYNVVVEPNLKDAELQKTFECVEPTDIVEKIFSPGEIALISDLALELAGYKNSAVSLVKDLKN